MSLNAKLLQESFQAVSYKGDKLTEIFYDKLFRNYPEVRPLFAHVRMEEQRKKLLHSIAVIVRNVEKADFLVPYLQGLGLTHFAYGAEPGHYDAVGECLLAALAEVAGDLWSVELHEAWTEAYTAIASIMKQGAAFAEKDQAEAA